MSWFAILFVLAPTASAAASALYGEILSPNFPQGYPNDVQKTWTVTVPEGYGIHIYFTHLDIESSENCSYDSVQISVGDVVEATLCGQPSAHARDPPTWKYERYFVSNSLNVVFTSDFSNQQRHTGFALYYVAEDMDECEGGLEDSCSHFCNNYIGGYFCTCPPEYFLHEDNRTCGVNCSGTVYTELKGEIASPNYPNPYPENSRCEYRIQLEHGYQIVVTFQPNDFDIEPGVGGRCIYDSLVVRANGRDFGPFCGSSIPSPGKIETQSNAAEIIFQTDSGGQNKGWKIRYHEEVVPCPNIQWANAKLVPQQPKYFFKDVVTVVCQEGFEVVEDEVGKKSFRTVCQSDGQWSRTKPVCQPVNCIPPPKIASAEVTLLSGAENYSYKAEIRYNCKPYYQMVSTGNGIYSCSADGTWVNSRTGTDLPKCLPVCGIPSTPPSGGGRIIGGTAAQAGMFPWQVYFHQPRGGGALISDEWVLTAAHVVEDEPHPIMYAGFINLAERQPGHALNPKAVYLHDNWKKGMPSPRTDYDNDIALVKLKTKVELSQNVAPICLPGSGPEYIFPERKLGYISGWGRVKETGLRMARVLQKADIPIVKMANCQSVQPAVGQSSQYVYSENMICAGGEGKDTCGGDSGGVFAVPSNDTYYAAGIVSWGPRCGTYGLYTKVRNYLGWIHETMEKHQDT
ncbi:complement C1s subcomponent isoform X2 [Ambystoma mexicanum]